MPSCPSCGADVQHAQRRDGEHIRLERWTDTTGDERYRIVELGPPLIAELVSPSSAIGAYPRHELDCPAHGKGLPPGVRD